MVPVTLVLLSTTAVTLGDVGPIVSKTKTKNILTCPHQDYAQHIKPSWRKYGKFIFINAGTLQYCETKGRGQTYVYQQSNYKAIE